MTSFLSEQLRCLGRCVPPELRQVEPGDWPALSTEAAEMSALAVYLLQRIEAVAARQQPADGMWDEAAARASIPLFQEWFEYATAVRDLRRACKEHGHPVEGGEEFLHSYNRAKMMAKDFDYLVETGRAIREGRSKGRPLREVEDELRRRDREGGG